MPEGYARSIHAGGHAQLAFREYPGTNFAGQITRTADSVDPNTRTMLAEVQIDNHSNKLVPGMYMVVTFPLAPGIDGPLLVTGDAIVIRHDQMTVANVENGKVQIVPVTIGRDFGPEVELLTGVQPGDVIVTNVRDEVVDGAPVQLRLAQTPEQQPQQPPSQKVPAGGSTRYSNQGLTDQKLQGRPGQENQKSQQNGKAPQNKNSKSESKP